jgi:hypothetical protein
VVLRMSASISSLIDVTVSAVRAEMKRIKPDIPVLRLPALTVKRIDGYGLYEDLDF